MPLFIDIEVLQQDPEPWMIPDVSTLEPPATHKKPDTIARWREERATNIVSGLRDQSSLNPILGGTVCAVGIGVADKPITALLASSGDEAGERALLQRLSQGLARYPDEQLVSYCGAHYDLPFLAKRALRHGLFELARRCFLSKPWDRHIVDVFVTWQMGDRGARGKLREVARFLGVETDDTLSGADVSTAWSAGDLDRVRHHVVEDVRLLREVYWWFRAAGWIVGDDPVPERVPRPCRVTDVQRVRDLMVDRPVQEIHAAAVAAGVDWHQATDPRECGPLLEQATAEQLRSMLAALERRAA